MLVLASDLLEAAVSGLEPFVAVDLLATTDHLALVNAGSIDDFIDFPLYFICQLLRLISSF